MDRKPDQRIDHIMVCIGCGQEGVPGTVTWGHHANPPGTRNNYEYCAVCYGTAFAFRRAISRDVRDNPPECRNEDVYQAVCRGVQLILVELRKKDGRA